MIVFASKTSKTLANSLIEELTGPSAKRAIAIRANLSQSPGEPEKHIVDGMIKEFPKGIDIIVNNAAKPSGASLHEMQPSDFGSNFRINMMAPILLVQAALPHPRVPGRIINISSSISKRGAAGEALL